MKKTTSRFDGGGLGIDLDRLRRKRDLRVLPVCALVGVLVLMGVLYLLVPKGKEEAPRPLSTKFIKRKPQMMRPLTMRKRPQPAVRPLKREKLVSEVPRAVADRAGISGLGGGLKVLESVVAHPKVEVVRRAAFRKVPIGPRIEVGEIRIARHARDRVDLALEMMDIESLDTGRYRGLVVIDPSDKRKVKGFLHLASVYAESMEEDLWEDNTGAFPHAKRHLDTRALQHLSRKMNEVTQIRTDVVESFPLDSERLLALPFALITAKQAFELTEAEAANLGRYLMSGGFAIAEVVTYWGLAPSKSDPQAVDLPSLRQMFEEAMRTQGLERGQHWDFERLDRHHPLYHCYFDFEDVPMGYWDVMMNGMINGPSPSYVYSPPYLEGIRIEGRWVALYSLKSYRDFWAGRMEQLRSHAANPGFRYGEERQLELGVNVLVFVLTQEGGIAKRMVACGE